MSDTIVLDFDGVLHSYTSGWTGPIPKDPPVPGSQAFVQKLLDMGWRVVIQSTRADSVDGMSGIRSYLLEHGYPQDVSITAAKPKGALYVDDRGLRFDGDFEKVLEFIRDPERMRPWYERCTA